MPGRVFSSANIMVKKLQYLFLRFSSPYSLSDVQPVTILEFVDRPVKTLNVKRNMHMFYFPLFPLLTSPSQ